MIGKKLLAYLKLMRFHRPIGIWLLLWPTLWALWVAADGHPDFKIVAIFVLGTTLMRAAGCIINDIADRNFDGFVKRTCQRPLVTAEINIKEALILFFILCLISFILVLQLNVLTISLSFIALLLAIIYPFTKRFTYWPQLFLGAAFACSVPMAFAAQTNHVPLIGWWLYLAAILWPLTYDTLYAMVDRADDEAIQLKSTAILFGKYDRLIVGFIQMVMLIILLGVGICADLNFYYYASLLLASTLMLYQQYLIRNAEPQACFKAFLNNQWVGAIIFAGIFLK